ncbi:putative spermidine/putrescine transport system ATP-binding protein [Bosea lupini]|uniref:Spermidine/putrescine import ATP-binding protein PotA n=1 Tax=Bosea lupini TaxID=1036779 RepID=A0A1H7TWS4_9HYPH|nr:putative spermidine/putrescine transport system ATP-binding protein [Bosea lupini]
MTDSSGAKAAMIEISGLRKDYGSVVALHDTELSVPTGEFLTLLGPSGSGKTTLLNLIAGMASPTRGRIVINGRDVTEVPAEKRGLGMVFQNYALMPHMTVSENIAFPLEIRKVPRAEIRRRVAEVLDLVRLPHVGDRKPKELSGGQQQRISIARCIVYKPDLILMDEPLGALDKKLREQMQLEIRRIHKELGITMLYVTHDQEEALNMSDRIMLMNARRVEQIGTPDQLYFAPRTQFAADFIGASTLLDATVAETGEPALLRLSASESCRVRLHSAAPVGTVGKLLLRPEALRLVQNGQVTAGHNVLHGHLDNTLVTGATSKHFVTLDNGATLAIQELTDPSTTRLEPGLRVQVSWPPETGRFLEN